MTYFLLIIGAMFVNNFVLCQFLGCCPFLGVSKKTDTALGMGLAVIFVMGIASVFTWLVQKLLVAAGIDYLQTIAFILVIAALVQLVEWCSKVYAVAVQRAGRISAPHHNQLRRARRGDTQHSVLRHCGRGKPASLLPERRVQRRRVHDCDTAACGHSRTYGHLVRAQTVQRVPHHARRGFHNEPCVHGVFGNDIVRR